MSTKEPKVVVVRFHDHSLGSGDTAGLIDCVVYGLLYEEGPDYYKIAPWHEAGVSPAGDPNADVFTLRKHPGMQIVYLKAATVSVLGKSLRECRQDGPRRLSHQKTKASRKRQKH